MRLKKPAVVLATAALMTLAACGGGGSNTQEGGGPTGQPTFKEGGNAGATKDPTATGPMQVPSDASKGGTLTILTANAPSMISGIMAHQLFCSAAILKTSRFIEISFEPR